MTLEELLPKFESVKAGNGGHTALCPAHSDQRRSLSLTQKNNKLLVHCFSGCDTAQILTSVGLKASDLFVDDVKQEERQFKPTFYIYEDLEGRPLYRKVRASNKTFWQETYVKGKWIKGLNGVENVLYDLPSLEQGVREGATIYFCEGEKDVDALTKRGLVSTTSGSVSSWRDEFSCHFLGADVVIFPDNDNPGRRFAKQVFESLEPITHSVKIVPLPVKEKGDVSDYLSLHSVEELLVLVERNGDEVEASNSGFGSISLADIKVEPVTWAWESRIPLGEVTLLAGYEGSGKSTLAYTLAAQLTIGSLDGDLKGRKSSVMVATAEDSLARVVRPRVVAAGGDLELIRSITFDGEPSSLSISTEIEKIEEVCKKHEIKLLIIDPVSAQIGEGVDSHKEVQVRRVMASLAHVAQRLDMSVLLVAHWSKGSSTNALDRVNGSRAFTAAARSALALSRDPEDENRLILSQFKSNLGQKATALSLEVVGATVEGIETSKVRWLGEAVGFSVDQVFESKGETKQGSCESWLEKFLSEGSVEASEVYRSASECGYSKRTVERAKKALGIVSSKEGLFWVCSLPKKDSAKSNDGVGGLLGGLLGGLEVPSSEGTFDGENRQVRQIVGGGGLLGGVESEDKNEALKDDEDALLEEVREAEQEEENAVRNSLFEEANITSDPGRFTLY